MDNEKWEGRGDQVTGKGKEVAGRVTGDKDTEAEGKGDQTKGKAKEKFGEVKDKVDEGLDKLRGK